MSEAQLTAQEMRDAFCEMLKSRYTAPFYQSSFNTVSECIDNTTREVEKLIKLLYQSIGVNPYDEYGNLRPDEDILSDLIAANLKIDISIDDIIGG
jgi:hypothetical protein